MQEWFARKKLRYVNMHVSWAWRGQVEQDLFFSEGKSRARYPNSPHNHRFNQLPCSLALDIFQIDEDGMARFSPRFYALLWEECQRDIEPIIWGGTFKSIGDAGHYQVDLKRLP